MRVDRCPAGFPNRAKRIFVGCLGRSGTVLEAPAVLAVIASLDDVAVLGHALEERGGDLGIVDRGRLFAEPGESPSGAAVARFAVPRIWQTALSA